MENAKKRRRGRRRRKEGGRGGRKKQKGSRERQGWRYDASKARAWEGKVTQGKASPTSCCVDTGHRALTWLPTFRFVCVSLLPSDAPFAVASVQLPPPEILAWLSPSIGAALSSKARVRLQRRHACRSAVTRLLSSSVKPVRGEWFARYFVTRNARCPAFVSPPSLCSFVSLSPVSVSFSVCFFGVDRRALRLDLESVQWSVSR